MIKNICSVCNGKGKILTPSTRMPLSGMGEKTCYQCGGSGIVANTICNKCTGAGVVGRFGITLTRNNRDRALINQKYRSG